MHLNTNISKWTLKEKMRRALWVFCWSIIGSYGPRFFSPARQGLLLLFGAKIGRKPLICAGVKILMPWNLIVGDYVALAEGVNIYNFGKTVIGNNTCLSQGVWLCTGSHDYSKSDLPLIWKSITIGSSVWLASDVFVHPGVVIDDGAVVGARSVVHSDLSSWKVYAGNPCRAIKVRDLS